MVFARETYLSEIIGRLETMRNEIIGVETYADERSMHSRPQMQCNSQNERDEDCTDLADYSDSYSSFISFSFFLG